MVHDYLGGMRVKIRFFHQKQLGKQAKTTSYPCSCTEAWFDVQRHMKQQGFLSCVQGRMRQPILRKL